ncbi:hypothetical protein LCGC14_2384500 [marine sediment metagenome]|uniref:HNH nuclease domain-containing protein n=1 Tax=marine sediment metagenome TaxID=412755 RepID=A0A0F9BZZ4_9ZZZZ
MRDLTDTEKSHLERLNELSFRKNTAGYFFCIDSRISRSQKGYKRSRIKMMLHLGKWLERWEIVHHKDGNKENDSIENLEVLNQNIHASNHHAGKNKEFPPGWKPANALKPEVIDRIREIAKEMRETDSQGLVNYSEISSGGIVKRVE